MRIVENHLQRLADDALRVDHPEQDERPDQRRDNHRQGRSKDRRPLEHAWQAVDAQRHTKTEDEHQRHDNESIGEREGESLVERKVHRPRSETAPAFARLPCGGNFLGRQVIAVDVGTEPVESPKRYRLAQGCRCPLIDRRLLRAPERAAGLDGSDHLFMLDVERLNGHRDDRQSDEQHHRSERRQDEPEESAIGHRPDPVDRRESGAGGKPPAPSGLRGSPVPSPPWHRRLRFPTAPARHIQSPAETRRGFHRSLRAAGP